jgi:hypothetical protein
MLPVEIETLRMAARRIRGMGRNPRFSGCGGIKTPVLVAPANWKIAVKRSRIWFHQTLTSLFPSIRKSTNLFFIKINLSIRIVILSIVRLGWWYDNALSPYAKHN